MDTAPSLSLPLPPHSLPLSRKAKPLPIPPQFAHDDDLQPLTPAPPDCASQPSASSPAQSSTSTPLQRRHRLHAIARRSAGPRKRRRCAPPVENGLLSDRHATDTQTSTRPSPNAHSSPETMDVCPPPLLPPVPPPPKHAFHPQNLNGSFDYLASPHRKQLYHRSLWPQIASAHHYLTGHPRTDPRFISNRRPLDCLEHLRASIVVTLLPDGYVRHDSTSSTLELPPSSPMATIQSPSPDVSTSSRQPSPSPNKPTSNTKNYNITTLPRYPYDRNSRHFLRCLDLGIIPPAEDLPEMSQRHYYDGCLLADINDLRYCSTPTSKPPPSNIIRVLLRPDMASLYHDLEQETAGLDPAVARAVERIIVKAVSGSLNLHPRPQLTSYTRDCAVHKLTHPLNIIRKPRRRPFRRPPGFARVPRATSASALLLISGAEKQQNLQRQTSLTMRALASEQSIAATKQSHINSAPNSSSVANPPTPRSKPEPALANGIKPGEHQGAVIRNPNKPPRPWRFSIPTRALLQSANQKAIKSDKAVGVSAQPTIQQQPLAAQMIPERVRTVQFARPDADAAAEYARTKALCEYTMRLGGHYVEKANNELADQAAKVSKGSMADMVVQLLRSKDDLLEVIYIWSSPGDKNRDYYRIIVANVAEGHLLINQVKSVVTREGYVCTRDVSQEQMLQIQRQKRLNQINQGRQGAVALSANAPNQQAPRPAYIAKHQQEQLANGVAAQAAGDANKNSAPDVMQSHGRNVQSKARMLKDNHKLQRQHLFKRRQQQQQQQQHQQEQLRRQHEHQILKEQIQRQGHLHPMMQHQQPTSRARAQVAHMGRMDKNGMNIHRAAGSIPNQIQAMVSKGIGQAGGNVQISQGLIDSMGLRNPNIANLGISTNMPHSQMFQPQQLQQLQQQFRQQQLQQQQQRGLMGHVNHAPNSYGRGANLNAFVTQNLQSRGLPGGWSGAAGFGSTAAADAGRGVAAKSIVGANGVNAARLQAQFTGENIDHSTLGKR